MSTTSIDLSNFVPVSEQTYADWLRSHPTREEHSGLATRHFLPKEDYSHGPVAYRINEHNAFFLRKDQSEH